MGKNLKEREIKVYCDRLGIVTLKKDPQAKEYINCPKCEGTCRYNDRSEMWNCGKCGRGWEAVPMSITNDEAAKDYLIHKDNQDKTPLQKAHEDAQADDSATAVPEEKIWDHNKPEDFIEYLEQRLIPDLKESGMGYTAEDFETAMKHIRRLMKPRASRPTRGHD